MSDFTKVKVKALPGGGGSTTVMLVAEMPSVTIFLHLTDKAACSLMGELRELLIPSGVEA